MPFYFEKVRLLHGKERKSQRLAKNEGTEKKTDMIASEPPRLSTATKAHLNRMLITVRTVTGYIDQITVSSKYSQTTKVLWGFLEWV